MSDLLFCYLRDILYTPEEASLDLSAVPAEEQQLAQGLMYLSDCMKEQRVFAKGLAKGDLEAPLPASDNPLTGELRALHGALTHLIWQAKQVTKGDFGQKLDFMGELSEVFNTMTAQLADRESRLEHEANIVRQQNHALEQSQNLLINLTEQMNDWILVTSLEDGTISFANESCQIYLEEYPEVQEALTALLRQCPKSQSNAIHWEGTLPAQNENMPARQFVACSQRILWNGEMSLSHILRDVTQERQIESLAYRDPLTRLYNRRYGMDDVQHRVDKHELFQIAFIDLDLLKRVNDELGHEEGNVYILDAAAYLSHLPDPKLICRIGGDEFLVITSNMLDLEKALEDIRTAFHNDSKLYERSFSYGVIDSTFTDDVSQLLREADTRMYQYKIAHKKQRMN